MSRSAAIYGLCVALLLPVLCVAQLNTLFSFNVSDGEGPQGVTLASGGLLFGSTALGGKWGHGAVYSLTPPASATGAWSESLLYSFPGYRGDGADPLGTVVVGSAAAGRMVVFGLTYYKHRVGDGTVFSLTAPASPGGAWTEELLHTFSVTPGDCSSPSELVMGAGGVLYGIGFSGGAHSGGAVFSLTPPTSTGGKWTETLIYSFGSAAGDGGDPTGLVMDGTGVLYGSTFGGGTANLGTVFSLKPPAAPGGVWQEAVLYSFQGSNDGSIAANVSLGSGGVLYGTTAADGASGNGTAFSLTPPASPGGAWTESVLYQFPPSATFGYGSVVPLVVGKNGVLYGGTFGANSGSSLFSLTPPAVPAGSWTENTLYSFTGLVGPWVTGLVRGPHGLLYGTTTPGGAGGYGTVFSFKP